MNKEIQTYDEKLQRAVAVIKEAILQGQYEACNMRKFYENWDLLDSNSASALAELPRVTVIPRFIISLVMRRLPI